MPIRGSGPTSPPSVLKLPRRASGKGLRARRAPHWTAQPIGLMTTATDSLMQESQGPILEAALALSTGPVQLPKNMATMSGDDERGRLERRPPWTISIDIPANSGECAEDPSAGEGDYSEVAAPGGEKDVSDSRVLTGRQPGFASRQAGDSLPSTRQKSQMSLL